MAEKEKNILNTIDSPDDLKKIPEDDLIQLCKELREKIIDECSEHPGHFGAGLGVVELTVALHTFLMLLTITSCGMSGTKLTPTRS